MGQLNLYSNVKKAKSLWCSEERLILKVHLRQGSDTYINGNVLGPTQTFAGNNEIKTDALRLANLFYVDAYILALFGFYWYFILHGMH